MLLFLQVVQLRWCIAKPYKGKAQRCKVKGGVVPPMVMSGIDYWRKLGLVNMKREISLITGY